MIVAQVPRRVPSGERVEIKISCKQLRGLRGKVARTNVPRGRGGMYLLPRLLGKQKAQRDEALRLPNLSDEEEFLS